MENVKILLYLQQQNVYNFTRELTYKGGLWEQGGSCLRIVIGSRTLLSIHSSCCIGRYRIYKLKMIHKFTQTIWIKQRRNTNLSLALLYRQLADSTSSTLKFLLKICLRDSLYVDSTFYWTSWWCTLPAAVRRWSAQRHSREPSRDGPQTAGRKRRAFLSSTLRERRQLKVKERESWLAVCESFNVSLTHFRVARSPRSSDPRLTIQLFQSPSSL